MQPSRDVRDGETEKVTPIVTSPANKDVQVLPTLSNVHYPISPTQPMLTDRANNVRNRPQLPYSLEQSPDRDEIILFAPL